jgi:hypothetical protein
MQPYPLHRARMAHPKPPVFMDSGFRRNDG